MKISADSVHNHNDITFDNTLTSSFTGGALTSGNYYLNEDITLSSNITIDINSGAINLCLNGKTINLNGFKFVITSGTLNIYDCDTNIENKKYFNEALWNDATYGYIDTLYCYTLTTSITEYYITGGLITGGYDTNGSGGAIVLNNDSILNLYGGSIAGNLVANRGGGVLVDNGSFNMYGGTLSMNTTIGSDTKGKESWGCGGGASTTGTSTGSINIYNGTINYNTAKRYGGALYSNPGYINVSGGTFTYNTARDYYGGAIYSNQNITLTGGTFTNNSSTWNICGGIFAQSTITLGGNPVVKNNTSKNDGSNLYIRNNNSIIFNPYTNESEGMDVHFIVYLPNTNKNQGFCASKEYENHLTYEWSTYKLFANLNNEETGYNYTLEKAYYVSYDKNGGEGENPVDSNGYENGSTAKALGGTGFIKKGYTFIGWNTDKDATTALYTTNSDILVGSSNITLYAIWQLIEEKNDNITFNQAITNSFTGGSLTTGNYYLFEDITLSSNITIDISTDVINLYLNSKTLNLNGYKIELTSGTLNIYDQNNIDNKKYFNVYQDSTRGNNTFYDLTNSITLNYVNGGIITGGTNSSSDCGAILISSNSVLNLYSGTIVGNNALQNGGAIYLDNGTFNMYGGSLFGNTCQGKGGAIYSNYGTINIYNGEISHNESSSFGGAIFVSKNASLTMSGGILSYNTTTSSYGGAISSDNNITITGGNIINNKSSNGVGGGLYIGKTITLGGNPIIKDNTVNNYPNNLYLKFSNSIIFNEYTSLSEGMDIHFMIHLPGTNNSISVCASNQYAKHFTYDDIKYKMFANLNNEKTSYNYTLEKVYSITYDINGGEGTSPIDNNLYKNGSNVKALDSTGISKTGYVFIGWNTDKSATTALYEANSNIIVGTSDITLYAIWGKLYSITYDINGGEGTSPIDNNLYKNGSNVKALDSTGMSKTGYVFIGWNTDKSATTALYEANSNIIVGTSDITLYAIWGKLYSITYDINGGEGTSPIDNNLYKNGSTVKALDSTGINRKYHIFLGWNTDKDATTALYEANSNITIGTSDITLYAIWEKKIEIVINKIQTERTYGETGYIVKYDNKDTITGFILEYFYNDEWNTTAPKKVGSYDVRIKRNEDSKYIDIEVIVENGLKINKKDLINNSSNRYSRDYNSLDALKEQFESLISLDGFMYDETLKSLNSFNSCKIQVDASSYIDYKNINEDLIKDAGEYTLNYEFSFENYNNITGTITFTINKIKVQIPTLKNKEYQFTGKEIQIEFNDFDKNKLVIDESSTSKATEKGTYEVKVLTTNNYYFILAASIANECTIEWNIVSTEVTFSLENNNKITVNYGETYTLPEFTLSIPELKDFVNVKYKYYNLADNTLVDEAINAGEYKVVYILESNNPGVKILYEVEKSVELTINKIVVSEPVLVGEYVYTGKEIIPELKGVEDYMIRTSDLGQTEPGDYEIVYILEENNYKWDSSSDGIIPWKIKANTILSEEKNNNNPIVSIGIKNGLNDNYSLDLYFSCGDEIEEDTSLSDFNSMINASFVMDKKDIISAVYKIKLYNSRNEEVNIENLNSSNLITLKLLIPEEIDISKITKIIYVDKLNNVSSQNFNKNNIIDGYYVMEVSSLGTFAFVTSSSKKSIIVPVLIGAGFVFIIGLGVIVKIIKNKHE